MSDHPNAGFGEAQSPGRREDVRLLTGQGRFTDDLAQSGQLHGVFLRSPMAHAEIRAIDTAEAETAQGFLGVFTGRDLESLGTLPCLQTPVNRNGDEPIKPPRRVLTIDLGVKGAGESGTVGALPTVANAVMDAQRTAGITRYDMPATSEQIWRLLQAAA